MLHEILGNEGLPTGSQKIRKFRGSIRRQAPTDTGELRETFRDLPAFALTRATAWQAAAFPRRVFGKRDRRATGPRLDRVLRVPA
jgi:hypothetical protein